MPMINHVAGQVLWFFLPALLANLAPVIANHIPWLARWRQPLDGGHTLRQRRILGDNKTYRGLFTGLIFGSITALIQYAWQDHVGSVIYPLHSGVHAVAWGAWLGFGALLGDAIKSFCKRQLGVAPGVSWPPFDQIDVVLGVTLVVVPWFKFSGLQFSVALLMIGCIMYTVSLFGVVSGIKKSL